MNPERWQQVKEIFNAVLEVAPDRRAAFLSEASAGDDDVRRNVEILLHSFESGFLEEPIVGKMAERIAENQFAVGQKLGHYEIREKIGAGGMGEVYLAQDTRLRRPVAIKFLLPDSTFDAKAEKRLLREAQSAAVLNHPNICTIHEIGESENRSFIVMEYVEGETLEERIRREPLSIGESLAITLNIADALTEAHSRGIVHRDIKPSNVIISSRGQVKVLDFSLAKKVFTEGDETTLSLLSQAGVIAGTIAYMSPEQVRGQKIDARSDIWSLGVVLYEMLTGFLPFAGETKSDIIALILQNEPLKNYYKNLPAEAERIFGKVLKKKREERYQTAEDFAADLRCLQKQLNLQTEIEGKTALDREDPKPLTLEQQTERLPKTFSKEPFEMTRQTASEINPVTDEREIRSSVESIVAKIKSPKIIVFAILMVFLGSYGGWQIVRLNRVKPLLFTADTRANLQISNLFSVKRKPGGEISDLSFSPDGNLFVFLLTGEGKSNVCAKQIGNDELVRVTDGNWADQSPVWSPDGQRIAFVSNRENKMGIWAVSYLGGNPVLLRSLDEIKDMFQLVKWSKNGQMLYYQTKDDLYTLNLENGQTALAVSEPHSNSAGFSVSSNEEMISFVKIENEKEQIWIQSLRGGQAKAITNNNHHNWSPVWFPDNQSLAYSSDQNGNFQIYVTNVENGEPTQITFGESNAESPVISPDGLKIAYISQSDEANIYSNDLDIGKETAQTSKVKAQLFPEISPDGQQIVFQITDDVAKMFSSPLKLKSVDVEGEPSTINSQGGGAKWSPDGKTLTFLRLSGNERNLWKVDINDRKESQLTKGGVYQSGFSVAPYNLLSADYSWSPDGKRIAYSSIKSSHYNLWTISRDGFDETMQTQNTADNVRISSPLWSPDGKRIAYVMRKFPNTSTEKTQYNICLTEDGQTLTIFQTESPMNLLGWSQSGIEVFVSVKRGTDADLLKVSTNSLKKQEQIARLSDANPVGIKISPTKKQFTFSARRDGNDNIYLVSSEGEKIRRLTANLDSTLYYSGITWSPDGKKLFYSKQTGGVQISMISNPK